jgi:hypothetical protein
VNFSQIAKKNIQTPLEKQKMIAAPAVVSLGFGAIGLIVTAYGNPSKEMKPYFQRGPALAIQFIWVALLAFMIDHLYKNNWEFTAWFLALLPLIIPLLFILWVVLVGKK